MSDTESIWIAANETLTFRLDKSGNSQSGILDQIILCHLDICRNPIPWNRVSNYINSQLSSLKFVYLYSSPSSAKLRGVCVYTIETPSLEVHIINQTSIIERPSILVHPVSKIAYSIIKPVSACHCHRAVSLSEFRGRNLIKKDVGINTLHQL